MNCSSGCPAPGTHKTFGECLRAKSTRVAYCNSVKGQDATTQRKWDKELSDYRDARRQGIQPAGTTTHSIREAVDISQATGQAFDASAPLPTPSEIP